MKLKIIKRKTKTKFKLTLKNLILFSESKSVFITFRTFNFPLISQNTFQILLTVLRTV